MEVTQEKLKTQFLLDSYSLCPTKQDIFITNSIFENLFLQFNFTNMEKLATVSHAKKKKIHFPLIFFGCDSASLRTTALLLTVSLIDVREGLPDVGHLTH